MAILTGFMNDVADSLFAALQSNGGQECVCGSKFLGLAKFGKFFLGNCPTRLLPVRVHCSWVKQV